jgi:predicted RNA binding protein YcfA (HicA-like mRNA interferase family)
MTGKGMKTGLVRIPLPIIPLPNTGICRRELSLARAGGIWQLPACAAQDTSTGCRSGAGRLWPRSCGKGSHRKFRHPKYPGFVLISGNSGDDAQHYQEKQLRNALRRIKS